MEKKIDYRDRDLVFVDLETTGLNPEIHEIIEVGILVVDGRRLGIKKRYYSKVKPNSLETADKYSLKKSGYRKRLWKNANNLQKVVNKIAKIAPGGMLAGWNVSFDELFIGHAFKKFKIKNPFDHHKIDVCVLAYKHFFNSESMTRLGLRNIAEKFGIKMSKHHDAMGDIEATFEIFKLLMKN